MQNKEVITAEYKGEKIRIMSVVYGESVLDEAMIFRGGNKEKIRDIVFAFYIIECRDKRIMVDGGCDTMPGFDMRNFAGPVKALEEAGFSPKDITDIVITHSHHDHIEGVKHFKDAIVHIQKDEYECGKGYLNVNKNILTFDDTLELTPEVTAVKIGGHTVGSCIVKIKDDNTTYVISGDECYNRECLDKKIPTGCSFRPQKSEEFVNEYSKDKYKVLLCHQL